MSGIMQNLLGGKFGGSPIYKFIGQSTRSSTTIYGGSTVNGMTILAVQPASVTTKATGVVVDGSFIAQAGNQYSLNGGTSWTTWMSVGGYTSMSLLGLNGGIAYNPTAKRAMSSRTDYDGYAFIGIPVSVTSTGSITTAATFYQGAQITVYNIIYSPTLNYFYVTGIGGGPLTNYSIDGTTGTGTANAGSNSTGNFRAGISNDGYVLYTFYPGGGTDFRLRKYTAVDFSTYTDYGFVTGGYFSHPYSTQSPFFWAPVNNKYLRGAAGAATPPVQVLSASSGSPQAYSLIGSFGPTAPNATGITSINFMEESDGTLWVFGSYLFTSGKSTADGPYTAFSTDGGVTWTQKSGTKFMSLSKNFT